MPDPKLVPDKMRPWRGADKRPLRANLRIRPLEPHDRDWVVELLRAHWHSTRVVSRGVVHHADRLPGFVALLDGKRVGLATYHLEAGACEIVTLNSLRHGCGVGSALVKAVLHMAQEGGCRRVWLVTTNDNLPALRFYRRCGFRLVAVHRGALERSRQLKPEIPLLGLNGVPMRDEIELAYPLKH